MFGIRGLEFTFQVRAVWHLPIWHPASHNLASFLKLRLQIYTRSKERLVKHFLPAILWAVVIFILSTVGGINAPDLLPDLLSPDKLAHTAAYFVQAALLGWGSYRHGYNIQKALLISVLTSSAFGILLEIVQYLFFPNRYFEWWDMVANVTGAILSGVFTLFLYRRK